MPLTKVTEEETTANEETATEDAANEETISEADSEVADFGPGIPQNIAALLTLLLGESITELDSEQLAEIAAKFAETITDLLQIAANIAGVPGIDIPEKYKEDAEE